MEASNIHFSSSKVHLEERLELEVLIKMLQKLGKVLVLCKLQWVSSWPRQTRSVQAMLARYVVQIVLTCLY